MNAPRSAAPSRKAPKLTADQKKEVRSLIDDEGYTRTEAVAWVTHFPVAS